MKVFAGFSVPRNTITDKQITQLYNKGFGVLNEGMGVVHISGEYEAIVSLCNRENFDLTSHYNLQYIRECERA